MLQTSNGPPLVGLVTIACHLTLEAKRPELLGDSAESRAVVQQWLEHRVTRLEGCRKDEVQSLLKVALLIGWFIDGWFIMQHGGQANWWGHSGFCNSIEGSEQMDEVLRITTLFFHSCIFLTRRFHRPLFSLLLLNISSLLEQ